MQAGGVPRGNRAWQYSYWLGAGAREFGWHMLDQVVLRREAAANFPEEHLQIVNRIGTIPLVDGNGVPDRLTASDHLPLLFRWDL